MSQYKRKPQWAIDLEWRAEQAASKTQAEATDFYRPPAPVSPVAMPVEVIHTHNSLRPLSDEEFKAEMRGVRERMGLQPVEEYEAKPGMFPTVSALVWAVLIWAMCITGIATVVTQVWHWLAR